MSQNGQKGSHSCWSISQINVSVVSGNEQLTFNFLNMFVSRGHPIGLTAFSLIEPISCTSSSQANENQGCENLYDFSVDGWEDNGQNCNNQWIEINFEDENLVEFIVLQNYQYEGLLAQKDKIKDLEIVTSSGDIVNHTLSNSSDSQWIDINLNTSSLRFNILSSYETIGVENCHLESIDIYGRS